MCSDFEAKGVAAARHIPQPGAGFRRNAFGNKVVLCYIWHWMRSAARVARTQRSRADNNDYPSQGNPSHV